MKWIDRTNRLAVLLQFVKFGIVGLSNTLISTGVYYVFIWIDPKFYFAGNVAGWIVSVANGFFWNNRFVFRDSEFTWQKKLLRTYLAYGGSLILGSVLLVLQVRLLGISEWLAPWINLVITIPLNFLLNKFWAFKA